MKPLSSMMTDKPKPKRRLVWISLVLIGIALVIALIFNSQKASIAEDLVGTWTFKAVTGETVTTTFRADGTYDNEYTPKSEGTPFVVTGQWESDGSTLCFRFDRDILDKALDYLGCQLGFQKQQRDEWSVERNGDNEVILYKPNHSAKLTMSRQPPKAKE